MDRMIAHTGYLLFARKIDRVPEVESPVEVNADAALERTSDPEEDLTLNVSSQV